MQLHVRFWAAAIAAISTLFAIGCGGSAYEAAFEQSLEKYRLQTGFIDISDERVTDLPKTDMTIRLPKIFLQDGSAALDAQSPDPRDDAQPLSRERVQPLNLELPGHLRTYETFVDAEMPEPAAVYGYLASVPAGTLAADALRKRILDRVRPQLAAEVRDETEWQEQQIVTPQGTTETWWVLSVTLPNSRFHYYSERRVDEGQMQSVVEEAVYDIYLHEGDAEHLLIAWRAAAKAAEKLELRPQFEASVGTVEFEKPEAVPAEE